MTFLIRILLLVFLNLDINIQLTENLELTGFSSSLAF